MMLNLAKLGIAMAVLAVLIVPAAYAGVPDVNQSFFMPQSGPVATPIEGAAAIADARRCPNNDGTQVLRNNSRLKIVVKASDGSPIVGIPASDICVLFNGGTPAQGFSGVGDDSIIANFQFNQTANCPDVRCVPADAPTDATGTTYLTWIGATPGSPGVGTRDPFRKWGGYSSDFPVMVLGFKLQGKLTTGSALGSYTAHVRSYDFAGGRGTALNQGEVINGQDLAPMIAALRPPYVYKLDFDNNGVVNTADFALYFAHNNVHDCNTPSAN